jgi:hypothetical protein
MQIYSENDKLLFTTKIDNIIKEIETKQLEILEPTKTEILAVYDVILDYCKKNNNKIFGGYALNLLIAEKNPDDSIYNENSTPDIDMYSPSPLEDLYNLCDILHEKGFKRVVGKNGIHEGTYKIFVNLHEYCDIGYVPMQIYNRIPFIIINKLHIVHPIFILIDYYRQNTDLLRSWRLNKTYNRFLLLQKNYPFPISDKNINVDYVMLDDKQQIIYNKQIPSNLKIEYNKVMSFVHSLLINKENILLIGYYAYNFYLNKSFILKDSNKKYDKFTNVTIPYFQIISDSFVKDAVFIVNELKKKYGDYFIVQEYYPFFQFTGYNIMIFYKNILILHIYNNNGVCFPFKQYSPLKISDEDNKKDSFVQIGIFNVTILYFLIFLIKERTYKNDKLVNEYYVMLYRLFKMRQFYLNKTKYNLLDDTPFKEFVINCLGSTMCVKREKLLNDEYKKKLKKSYGFNYNPSKKSEKMTHQFKNASGNIINNPKNLKIKKKYTTKHTEEYTESSTDSSVDSSIESSIDLK